MSLTMQEIALKWLDANKTVQTFTDMKNKFLEASGQSLVDHGLRGGSGKMTINEDLPAHIFHVLRYVEAITFNATEVREVSKLFESLPPHFKACFVSDRLTSVEKLSND